MTNSSAQLPQTQPTLSLYQSLSLLLKDLRLSHMLTHWKSIETQALQEHWFYAPFLLTLCELEVQRRHDVRLKRAIAEAQLPSAKGFSTSLLPVSSVQSRSTHAASRRPQLVCTRR